MAPVLERGARGVPATLLIGQNLSPKDNGLSLNRPGRNLEMTDLADREVVLPPSLTEVIPMWSRLQCAGTWRLTTSTQIMRETLS